MEQHKQTSIFEYPDITEPILSGDEPVNATLTKIAASLAALLITCSASAGDYSDDRSEYEDGFIGSFNR
ncbi:MAG: hypothetical protein B6D75_11460 [gamma proteobacterium symbiont of Stewartia floridana]|nr:MAG: hypothetical protein B6D75_11460 [gamma proteobacterium symbiont of Stewartia floridana]